MADACGCMGSRSVAASAPGMVRIPGGAFLMGSDRHYPEERPAHLVRVDGFCMDATTVTSADFARFVAATGYVTVAERPLDPAAYPGAKPEMLVPGARGKRKGVAKVAEESGRYENELRSPSEISKRIRQLEEKMYQLARDLEFEAAAQLRDEIQTLRERLVNV